MDQAFINAATQSSKNEIMPPKKECAQNGEPEGHILNKQQPAEAQGCDLSKKQTIYSALRKKQPPPV